ncbi:MAG: 23S rRNA (adenine(2503)-C(2))-methyltransferase [Candidatus Omnitrophica bacterium 4484_171]|nr:MAG: 23S rRNA (adenine(2503)-C(2))-methyltransferase [Candidatus Omnitrophica bacterium 4484_171]
MKDIKNYTLNELGNILERERYPAFCAKQIFSWVYKRNIDDFSKMSDLSKAARQYLKSNFYISSLKTLERKVSVDGTEKFLFALDDKNTIETVIIPKGNRNTLCVSTQVGCRYGCKFCVSGLFGFKRNLKVSEIINQFIKINSIIIPKAITNVVFMGIGEPLDNFDNVIKSISIMTSPFGIHFGRRRITISTCGITPKVKELLNMDFGVKLSISLHSADNRKRSLLMPVNKLYPLAGLIDQAKRYAKKYRFPVTFEYILIKDINSKREDALNLSRMLRGLRYKINIIPYNPAPAFKWQVPSFYDINSFTKILKRKGVFFTLRRPRGQDIEAACGQLRIAMMKNEKRV